MRQILSVLGLNARDIQKINFSNGKFLIRGVRVEKPKTLIRPRKSRCDQADGQSHRREKEVSEVFESSFDRLGRIDKL